MLNLQAKIDLCNTDPHFSRTINGAPLPLDEYLFFKLGNDYDKYTEMFRDTHVRSNMQKRRQSILGRDIIIETPGGQTKEEVSGSIVESFDKTENILTKVRYETLCSSLLRTGQLIGFSVVQLDWKEEDGLVLPQFKTVPQKRFTFAAHEPNKTNIPVAGNADKKQKVDPKKDIVMVQDYELRLLTQRNPVKGERCPKNRFIVYTFDSDGAPWGLGLGYSIYPWWLIKKEAMKAWLLHSDRLGSPPVLGTHPADINEEKEEYKQIMRDFDNFLKAISPNGWGKLPQGFDAKVLAGLEGAGPGVHQALIATADEQISKVILGEIQFSDKPSGSYAANASQVEDRDASLIDADVNLLDEQLDDQFWAPVRELNFNGNGEHLIIRRETVADRRKAAKRQQKEEAFNLRMARDKVLILEMGLKPTKAYIQKTYGDDWEIPEQFGQPAPQPQDPPALKVIPGGRAAVNFENKATRYIYWNDLTIGVEFEVGQERFGKTMEVAYGYIARHLGADGDALDCYLGPDLSSQRIFRIRQVKPDGMFDEHKYMFFFDTEERAARAFKRHIPLDRYGGIEEVSLAMVARHERTGRSMVMPSEVDDYANYAEPVRVKRGELMNAWEFDEIAEDIPGAIRDADRAWQSIAAPNYLKSILAAGSV